MAQAKRTVMFHLEKEHQEGKVAREQGLSVNPYPAPFFLSRGFCAYDAWDSGHSGESFESFSNHPFYR
jgi:hypothetical protein